MNPASHLGMLRFERHLPNLVGDAAKKVAFFGGEGGWLLGKAFKIGKGIG